MNGIDISPLIRRLARRHNLPRPLRGDLTQRRDPCGFCGANEGESLYRLDYWDIKEMWVIKCTRCQLMQVDPMPTFDDVSLGCRAFFLMEKSQLGRREMLHTCVRNFRKGVAFGIELKKRRFAPRRSLEIGAGDAYFSRGLSAVFPDLVVSALDVVPEVLADIRRHHGFKTIQKTPEELTRAEHGTFDVVIARDILEHVTAPGRVLDQVAEVLESNGLFHFITPNGHEDIWRGYAHWTLRQTPGELLINHLNYFDPPGLRKELTRRGLTPEVWRIYDFKGYRKGKGRRVDPKVTQAPSTKRSAHAPITEVKAEDAQLSEADRAAVLDRWWVRWRRLGEAYCAFRHAPGFTSDADLSVGHEIHGLYRRSTP